MFIQKKKLRKIKNVYIMINNYHSYIKKGNLKKKVNIAILKI